MKRISLVLLILGFQNLLCQNKVGYSYDNNGNRIQRFFIGLRPAGHDSTAVPDSALNSFTPPSTASQDPQQLAIQYGIKVYPNPTRDIIVVSITRDGEKESKQADMVLIDNVGKLIGRKKYSGTDISFDLSNNPPGTYYLRIVFADKGVLTYNVVKIN